MSVAPLRIIMIAAFCFTSGALAVAAERPHHTPALSADARETVSGEAVQPMSRSKKSAARTLKADRDPYADPAAPYKADRLASPSAEPIVNLPGSTVLTRQVLDDMNATTLRDALRSTPGVTIGR